MVITGRRASSGSKTLRRLQDEDLLVILEVEFLEESGHGSDDIPFEDIICKRIDGLRSEMEAVAQPGGDNA